MTGAGAGRGAGGGATCLRTGGPDESSEVSGEVDAMASTLIWLPRASAICSKLSIAGPLAGVLRGEILEESEEIGIAELSAQHVEECRRLC